jgi:hypothetical protein
VDSSRKASLGFGIFLIAFGAILFIFSLVPGAWIGQTWPVIFILIAACFYLPPFLWPESRHGLAALFIPGSVFLSLGLIFIYSTLTEDWVVWAYAWLLIITGVGLGILLASIVGHWGNKSFWAGIWIVAISIGLFGLFATLFGNPVIKIIGAVLVILVGVFFLLRAIGQPRSNGMPPQA